MRALNSAASRDGAGTGLEWGWDGDQGLDREMQHAAWHSPQHTLTPPNLKHCGCSYEPTLEHQATHQAPPKSKILNPQRESQGSKLGIDLFISLHCKKSLKNLPSTLGCVHARPCSAGSRWWVGNGTCQVGWAVFLCCLRCEQPSMEKENPVSIKPPPLLPCTGHLHIPHGKLGSLKPLNPTK